MEDDALSVDSRAESERRVVEPHEVYGVQGLGVLHVCPQAEPRRASHVRGVERKVDIGPVTAFPACPRPEQDYPIDAARIRELAKKGQDGRGELHG